LQPAVRIPAVRAAPVLVMTNGPYEQQSRNLAQVVNVVVQQCSYVRNMQALFGVRLVVAYRNSPSLRRWSRQ
jgi:hypothetical protein